MTPQQKAMFEQFLRHGYPGGSGHPRALGFEFVDMQPNRGVLKLPYRADLAGDADDGILAGGAVTALLDHTCGLAVLSGMEQPGFTATLDLRIDYQRPAEPGKDLIVEARCYRRTRTIAFVRAEAYHEDAAHPVATAQATFVLTTAEGGAA